MDLLETNGIDEFWLDKGTLLGAVRGGDLIRWEYDVDISMMEATCEKYANATSTWTPQCKLQL